MYVKSFETIMMKIPEYRVLKSLMLYVPPILIVLGTLGNVFSFVILRRRAMVKVSSYHYLASLAVADSLVLYIGLLRLWLGEATGADFHHRSDWVCKLTISLSYMASDLSVWLIIAVTVERYIVVCFPLKASTMINTQRAKKVIAFLVLLMFTINLHFFWTVQVVERSVDDRNVSNCEASPSHQRLVNEIWPWVDACIYSFVPFIAILVLNVFIICEVVEARNQRQHMQSVSENKTHQMTRQEPRSTTRTLFRRSGSTSEGTKLTIMLLTVSFTFLLTTLPLNISLIVAAFWQHKNSLRQMAQFKLASTVAELLMYVNHSINFFLYCATGNKFRQQIVHMLTCKTRTMTSWSSIHTDDMRLQTSVRRSSHKSPHKHSLVMNAIDEDYTVNGELIPLRAV